MKLEIFENFLSFVISDFSFEKLFRILFFLKFDFLENKSEIPNEVVNTKDSDGEDSDSNEFVPQRLNQTIDFQEEEDDRFQFKNWQS